MSLEDTVNNLNQTTRSVKSNKSSKSNKSGTNSMSATQRDRDRLDEITKQAAVKLGLNETEAKQLYWGGLQTEIVKDGVKEKKIVTPDTSRRVMQEDIEIIEERVIPSVAEVRIILNEPFERLGIIFAGDTPRIKSIEPRSPAARSGLLPMSVVTKIDHLDIYNSLQTMVQYLKSIRLAKRTEFMIEVFYETPPLNLFDAFQGFQSPGLSDIKRIDPSDVFRNRKRDCATYHPTPADTDATYTFKNTIENSQKIVDSKKTSLRYPEIGKEYNSPTDANIPVTVNHPVFKIPEWLWKISLDEESKRGDILRHYKGFLLQVSREFSMFDGIKSVAETLLREISAAGFAYYQEPVGWSTVTVWEFDLKPFMRPPQEPIATPLPPFSQQDWVNPVPREVQSLHYPTSARRGTVMTPADIPRWAEKSFRVVALFACGGLGRSPQ
eukprot:TRINITY_DN6519_c1_g2_i1.p1 TRINITY_DN6519_c1_g2~~TRINITY_DN6519_c1_g2_i1.p1  ORF type:complete len:454 (+),score=43.10 TRINITY_DN6519_c1_g2_i1:46-1362(+)